MADYKDEPWIWTRQGDFVTELRQATEEGKDVTGYREKFDAFTDDQTIRCESDQAKIRILMDEIIALPVVTELAGKEPSDLPGIHAVRPDGPRRLKSDYSEARLLEKIHGAWLGRCCGCFLGKPVEGTRNYVMKAILESQGRWPLSDYFARGGISDEVKKQHNVKDWFPPYTEINHMPEDDDTNYTTTGLAIFERHGRDFTPEHVAEFWLRNIPLYHVCTAERIAYRNLANGIFPPKSAVVRNPYREWIGAQIRADFWGYVAVGNPELAADFAWRDACISHIKNGIYGEMWVAAMLAAAYAIDDPLEVIRIGLTEIPADCRLTRAINNIIALKKAGKSYDEAAQDIHSRWDQHDGHDWCHTISNAEIVAVGLLWGEGDFGKSICRAVQIAFDTDCNGATVGSIMGMILGVNGIPAKWGDRLSDTLETGVAGYHRIKISEIARASVKQAQKLIGQPAT